MNTQLKTTALRAAAVLLPLLAIYLIYAAGYESTDDAYIDADFIPISARVAGHLDHVFVHSNQRVAAGEPLATLDAAPLQARFDQARAEVNIARAEESRARADLARFEPLARRDEISKLRLAQVNADAEKAQGALDAAIARAKQAELDVAYARITAPIAGRITQNNVAPGMYVQIGQPLFAIVPDELYVVANFKETQIRHMHPGAPVKIYVDALGRSLRGHVDSRQAGSGARFSLFPPENATGNFVKVVQRVPVQILFDESPDDLKLLGPGMSVVPTVKVR